MNEFQLSEKRAGHQGIACIGLYFLLLVSWVFLLVAFGGTQSLQSGSSDPSETYTISLNVDLVVLDVTVLDKKGGFVSGLNQRHFEVHEDGKSQNLDFFQHGKVPVTLGLVVDNSGSMMEKRSEVITAALTFIKSLEPHDEIFVVNFNEDVELGLPLDRSFSNDLDELKTALTSMVTRGQTAFYDAMALAFRHLKKGRYNKKALLVISDGADNASQLRFQEILTMTQQSQAMVYSIALYDPDNKDQNSKVLKRLSKTSGGEFFFPSSVSEVDSICQRISRDIRSQYSLGYTPTNRARDGSYRSIRVTVNAPERKKLLVRTREGYFAPLSEQGERITRAKRSR